MVRALLIRGMAAGVAAGLLVFAFAYAVGEPQLNAAIRFEHAAGQSHGEGAEPAAGHSHGEDAELAPGPGREVQSTIGLLTGSVLIAVGLGGLLSLVFAYGYGRLSRHGPRAAAALLALIAFVTVTLVPFAKYPPNPPGVGSAGTVDQRTVLFFAMIAIAIAAAVAAARVRRQFEVRLGSWNAAIVAGAVFVALVGSAGAILPAVRATPDGFPADVLYGFRVASLGTSATLWLALGLIFGALADRVVRRAAR